MPKWRVVLLLLRGKLGFLVPFSFVFGFAGSQKTNFTEYVLQFLKTSSSEPTTHLSGVCWNENAGVRGHGTGLEMLGWKMCVPAARQRPRGMGEGREAKERKARPRGRSEREREVNEDTELYAYAQLLPLSSRPENKTGGSIVSSSGQRYLGVVSSMAATRPVTVDGVTKKEYILRRRFSDGQKEMLQELITRRS
ncbi:hypothetical protein B9Z19DRAFT_1069590 [Tuber borchii]|uniref:Uncharacterized protein n=1 Tax=Tuber borchii TaxID=42251 RepID=A0A2T6ZB12_TUBBO|nr:hypothetical protein B9Z19DRAFT_1069590 [Tuber borchii]